MIKAASSTVALGTNGYSFDQSAFSSSSFSSSSSSITFFPTQPVKLSALPAGLLTCFYGIEGFALLNPQSDFIRIQLCAGRCPAGLSEDHATVVLREIAISEVEGVALVPVAESSAKVGPDKFALRLSRHQARNACADRS